MIDGGRYVVGRGRSFRVVGWRFVNLGLFLGLDIPFLQCGCRLRIVAFGAAGRVFDSVHWSCLRFNP